VAKLRELKTDDNLLLLCTDMDSGTAGNRGVLKAMKGGAGVRFLIGLAQGTLPGQADV
jgi:oligopeptidase B